MIAAAVEGLVGSGAELADGLLNHRDPRSAVHFSNTQGRRAWQWMRDIPDSPLSTISSIHNPAGESMSALSSATSRPTPTRRPALTKDTFSPKSVIPSGMGMSELPSYSEAMGTARGAFGKKIKSYSKKIPHLGTIGLLANTATNIAQTVHIKKEGQKISDLMARPVSQPSRTFYVQ